MVALNIWSYIVVIDIHIAFICLSMLVYYYCHVLVLV